MHASTSPESRGAQGLKAWRNAIFIIFVLSGMALSTMASRLPAIRSGIHLDVGQVGLLLLCASIGSVFGLAVSPPSLARFGPRAGMAGALLIAGAGLVVIGIGADLTHLVPIAAVGLAALGFGNGCVDVMMNVEGTAVEKQIGKTLLPLMHAGFSLGTIIGAGCGAAASALNISVFAHLTAVAVVIIAGVLIAVRYVPREVEQVEQPPKLPVRARLRASVLVFADWRLILIGVVMLGMSFTEGSANDWLTIAVHDDHGQTDAIGAVVLAVFTTFMTIMRLIGGPLVDRVGRTVAIRITGVIGLAGLLIFILAQPLWLVIVGTALWAVGAALGFPLGMSAAADSGPNPAVRVGAVAMIGYVAFLVGPPVIGFLGQTFGLLNALYLIVGLLTLSVICSGAVRVRPTDNSQRAVDAEPPRV